MKPRILSSARLSFPLACALAALLALTSASAATLTWDNVAGGTINDGGGAWLGAGLWNNGSPSINWTSGDDAIFGIGGVGGAVTLASPTTVNSLTFNSFTTTAYTLGAATQTITLNNGITMNSGAFNVTFVSPVTLGAVQAWTNNSANTLGFSAAGVNLNGKALTIGGSGSTSFDGNAANVISGAGGIVKNGSGNLTLDGGTAVPHTFTGGITISGSGRVGAQTGANLTGRGNVSINGGYLGARFGTAVTFAGGLGTGATAIQITGGTSGFSGEGNTGSTFTIGTAASVLKWGASTENGATGFFNPAVLLLNGTQSMNTNGKGTLANGIDLNGTSRTITSTQTTDGAVTSGFTVSGTIVNTAGTTAGLEKTGVGNLILSNTGNTYDGTTTISGGWITAAGSGSLGSGVASNTLIFNGGTLRATAIITSPSTRGVTMTATGIIDNNGQAISFAGNIGGAGGLTKNSTGTLTLSGTNSFSGVTTVNSGMLAITKEVSLASNTAANLNVKSGASLALNVDSTGAAGFTVANLDTLLGNILVANNAAQGLQAGALLGLDTATADLGTYTQGNAITNSTGAFGGAIGLTKLGTGTLVLDKTNTYTGPTTISAGTLQLDAGGVIAIATPILNNATFAINSAGSVSQGTNFGLISGNGAVTNVGAGTLTLNLANTYSGLTSATSGTIALTNALAIQNSALVTTSGTTTYAGAAALTIGGLSGAAGDLGSSNVLNGYTGLVTALTLNPQTGVSVTYGGIISDGSGTMSLTKTGAGTQILTGANSYTGATIVNAGNLSVGVGGSLSASSVLQINGGIFSYANASTGLTLNGLAVGGNSTVSNTAAGQTLTLGAITRTASIYGTVNFSTLTGPISTTTGNVNGIIGPWATTGSTTTLRYVVGSPDGSTPTNITPFTAGTLATANTLGNVTDASLNYEYSAAVAAMPASTALTGNTLRYSGAATSTAINATSTLTLNGLMQAGTGLLTISGGPTTGGILIGSTGELVISANTAGTTISAAIGGTGRVVYNGAGGRLLLSSATSNYSGGTVINSGQLAIASNAALGDASGSITLNGGSLLGNTTNPQAGNGGGVSITSARDVIVGVAGGSIGAHGNANFTTSGKLSGTGTLTMLALGGGGGQTLNFNSTSNDFTGAIVISTGNGTVTMNSLADSANNIVFNGTTGAVFTYNTGATAPLVLNSRSFAIASSFSNTISNLNTTQGMTINTPLLVTASGALTLTLNAATGPTNAFAGKIPDGPSGSISLSKSGTGNWALNSTTNTFTGTITLGGTTTSSGTLSYASASGANPITFSATTGFNSTLSYTGSSALTMSGLITASALTTGSIIIEANGAAPANTINYSNPSSLSTTSAGTSTRFINLGGSNTGDNTFAGAINNNTGVGGNAQLAKTGAGKWVLTGASNFSGGFFLNQGTVSVASIPDSGVNSPLGANTRINLGRDNNDGILIYTGAGDSTNRDLRIGGLSTASGSGGSIILNDGSGALTFTAATFNISQTGILFNRTLTLGGTYTGAANEIQGVIQNNTASTGLVNLAKTGDSTWVLTGANTYTGDTVVSAGTLALADNAQLTFMLGATSGVNNSISGAGTVTLDGDFVIDTTAANVLTSGTWTLENVPSLSGAYGSTFTVVDFTDDGGNKWTKVDGAKTYTFDETTGVLTLTTAGYASWASTNTAGPNLNDDHDNDGVSNGIEYFLGGPLGNTTGFTALPGIVKALDNKLSVTWPKGSGYAGIYGTDYVVETSDTLTGLWTVETSPGVTITDSSTEVKFTFPGGAPYSGKNFARLRVTGP
jgi:autotransporter-associated beta strand protein